MDEYKTVFTEKMSKNRTVQMGQHSNGIYWATIREKDGTIESATTKKTSAEVWRWIEDHEK